MGYLFLILNYFPECPSYKLVIYIIEKRFKRPFQRCIIHHYRLCTIITLILTISLTPMKLNESGYPLPETDLRSLNWPSASCDLLFMFPPVGGHIVFVTVSVCLCVCPSVCLSFCVS